jgi:hypothetical protein
MNLKETEKKAITVLVNSLFERIKNNKFLNSKKDKLSFSSEHKVFHIRETLEFVEKTYGLKLNISFVF